MSLNMGIEDSDLKNYATKVISTEWQIFNTSFMDCLRYDRKIVLEGDMMVKSDRIYMQHGIESRPVFAINIMPEFIQKFKLSELISFRKMKLPLIRIADELPKFILNRRKTGFESPLEKIPMEAMNQEIQYAINNILPHLTVSNLQLITNCFYKGLESSSARETYVVYVISLWLKINSNQLELKNMSNK